MSFLYEKQEGLDKTELRQDTALTAKVNKYKPRNCQMTVDHNSSVIGSDDDKDVSFFDENQTEGKATYEITFWLKSLDNNQLK